MAGSCIKAPPGVTAARRVFVGFWKNPRLLKTGFAIGVTLA